MSSEIYCLVGGAFSPPHKGHAGTGIMAALALLQRYPNEKIIIAFSASPDTYEKGSTSMQIAMSQAGEDRSQFISEQERLEMVMIYCKILNDLFHEGGSASYFDMPSLTIPKSPNVEFIADTTAIDKKYVLYLDILKALRKPGRSLSMLLGDDNMRSVKNWEGMEEVADIVDTFIVVKRGDVKTTPEEYEDMYPAIKGKGKVIVVDAPPDYSSTKIRKYWNTNDYNGVASMTGKEIADYMKTQRIGTRSRNNVRTTFSKNAVIKEGGRLKRTKRQKRKSYKKSRRVSKKH